MYQKGPIVHSNRNPPVLRSRTLSLGNVGPAPRSLSNGPPPTVRKPVRYNRSASVSVDDSRPGSGVVGGPCRAPRLSTSSGTSRKNSIASLGDQLFTLSTQGLSSMAHSVGENLTEILPSHRRQSISPNEVLDLILLNIKKSMKERDAHQMGLPDQAAAGIQLVNGQLSGLTNLSRWGEAQLETRPDKICMTFTIAIRDLHATYSWKKKQFTGEVATGVNRVLIQLKIRQNVQGTTPPEITEFIVGNMEGVHVGVHGLGPFNWLAKKVVLGVVHQNIKQVLEIQGKEIIKQELKKVSIVDQLSFKILPGGII